MSSNTAIKDVTRGLQLLLQSQLSAVSSAAQVSLLPPGEAMPSGLGVNLYLYRVMESAFTKNQQWPGDRKTPGSDMPALGLELHYLLTPFAASPDPSATIGDDAHTMLGAAMLAFHQYPLLKDVHIKGFDADAVLPQAIQNSFEQIKIRLAITSIEELSKIWATINQPYRLSVAYEVSLVELAPAGAPPVNGSVVLSTGLNVSLWQAPRLESLSPAIGALGHVVGNAVVPNTLTISGSGLSSPGQSPSVLVGGQAATINAVPAPTDNAIAVTLPVNIDAGPNEDVELEIHGKSGAPLTFTASPWLSSLTPIRSELDTSAGPPALVLKGSGFTAAPQAIRFDGPSGATNVTTFAGSVTDTRAMVAIPPLPNGLYQVRIVLAPPDNSVSNARTFEVIPLLKSPIALAVTTVSGNQVHQLTLNGARLSGTDLRVVIDGIGYQADANASDVQLVLTLGRLLDPGQHSVSVVVDGSRSHDVVLEVS